MRSRRPPSQHRMRKFFAFMDVSPQLWRLQETSTAVRCVLTVDGPVRPRPACHRLYRGRGRLDGIFWPVHQARIFDQAPEEGGLGPLFGGVGRRRGEPRQDLDRILLGTSEILEDTRHRHVGPSRNGPRVAPACPAVPRPVSRIDHPDGRRRDHRIGGVFPGVADAIMFRVAEIGLSLGIQGLRIDFALEEVAL